MKFYVLVTLSALQFGCSHNYFFVPEVSGAGEIHTPRAVIYSLPAEAPVFKMKLSSQGVQHGGELQVRMYFLRVAKGKGSADFIDPQDFFITAGENGSQIHPDKFYGPPKVDAVIKLDTAEKQLIEMSFPLAKFENKESQLPDFTLHWKIHLSRSQVEARVTRFDRKDSVPPTEHAALDGYFPYEDWSDPNSDWIPNGWLWY